MSILPKNAMAQGGGSVSVGQGAVRRSDRELDSTSLLLWATIFVYFWSSPVFRSHNVLILLLSSGYLWQQYLCGYFF